MLFELGAGFILAKTAQYLFSEESNIRNTWKNTLLNCRVEGIRNKENKTFLLNKIYKKDYGYLCTANIPTGLCVEALEKAKKVLEDNLNCIVDIEKERGDNFIKVKLIKEIKDHEFEPVETKPHELFLGYKLDGSLYKINLNMDPHILIAGKTGTGKSFMFATILTNLFYKNKKDFEVYLLQVKKGEIDIFRDCPNVKFTSDNTQEILVILEKLSNLIHRRSKQFASCGIKNISQWNKHFPKQKMKRIIVGVEEISFFMADEESESFRYFNEIVKAGRSAGIHLIALTQRTTAANLGGNGELKSQLTVITAKQRTELDSRNAIDINEAAYLKKQEFICSGNDGYVTFKAPTVDEDFKILNKYVPEIKIPGIKKEEKKSYNSILSYEETLKLRQHYECYKLPENKPVEKPKAEKGTNALPKEIRRKKGVKAC